jgi:polyisoprenyl-phosphate glycosyltransferase
MVRYDFRVTSNAMLVMVTSLIIGSMALLADLIVRSRDDR